MRASELRELSVVELDERLVQLRTDLAKERASVASGSRAEKPAKIRNLRRGIARVLTIMGQKAEAKQVDARGEAK